MTVSVLLFLLFMFGFWLFVRWDQRKLEKAALSRNNTSEERGLLLIENTKWKALLALSILFSAGAAAEFEVPRQPPFTGKLSLLRSAAYDLMGVYGYAYFCVVIAIVFGVAAYLEKQHPRAKKK